MPFQTRFPLWWAHNPNFSLWAWFIYETLVPLSIWKCVCQRRSKTTTKTTRPSFAGSCQGNLTRRFCWCNFGTPALTFTHFLWKESWSALHSDSPKWQQQITVGISQSWKDFITKEICMLCQEDVRAEIFKIFSFQLLLREKMEAEREEKSTVWHAELMFWWVWLLCICCGCSMVAILYRANKFCAEIFLTAPTLSSQMHYFSSNGDRWVVIFFYFLLGIILYIYNKHECQNWICVEKPAKWSIFLSLFPQWLCGGREAWTCCQLIAGQRRKTNNQSGTHSHFQSM